MSKPAKVVDSQDTRQEIDFYPSVKDVEQQQIRASLEANQGKWGRASEKWLQKLRGLSQREGSGQRAAFTSLWHMTEMVPPHTALWSVAMREALKMVDPLRPMALDLPFAQKEVLRETCKAQVKMLMDRDDYFHHQIDWALAAAYWADVPETKSAVALQQAMNEVVEKKKEGKTLPFPQAKRPKSLVSAQSSNNMAEQKRAYAGYGCHVF